jgi:methionyl-tRNA formyltransferase
MKHTIAIAGSTHHTVQCATALLTSSQFDIAWILTPQPKPVGRKKILTKNPLHQFAEENNIPVILLERNIDVSVEEKIQRFQENQPIDFLLVVDFGYIIPTWLLHLPKTAPLNIHPSLLPEWRGSSPGQFSLLYGNTDSAVSIIVMDDGLDTGPIVKHIPFSVQKNWTQTEYYAYSFALVSADLPHIIDDFSNGVIKPQAQPDQSPTPPARRLTKEDGFIEWSVLKNLLQGKNPEQKGDSASLFSEVALTIPWPEVIENAVRAFNPWPLVWTVIPTAKGEKRMQILAADVKNGRLEIEKVKIEGQEATDWTHVKNTLL